MNNFTVRELYSEKHTQLPNVNSLLKISLGLILFTMISTALVYAETMSVDVEGNSFDVEYTTTGLTVSAIEADTESISLILTVEVPDSTGTLDITFDRSFFDATFEGLDDEFLVLIDADFANYSETETTSESRTLSIEAPPGTEEIEIIGYDFGDSTMIEVQDTTDAAKAAADADAAKAAADADAAKAAADADAAKAAADADAAKAAADADAAKAAADADAAKAAADDTLATQCGPGTILQDGACVLDERCGPGTILQDGACILDSTPQPSSSSIKGMGKDMVMGVIIAFIGAGIVGIVFALIGKANKSS